MHVIFLHGFNSAGSGSDKVKALIEHFGPDNVHAPDLSYVPDEAVTQISSLLEKFDDLSNVVLVGASLGGFYASYFSKTYGLKCVLINPSVDPMVSCCKYLGENTNFKTGEKYTFTHDHIDMFKKYYVSPEAPPHMPTVVLVNSGDEVLDANRAIEHYHDWAIVRVFEGGDHRFSNMAPVIRDIHMLENIVYE